MAGIKRGFLSIEYTLLIAILVGALIGMSVYLRRSISGKWRTVADVFGYGRQYQPAR